MGTEGDIGRASDAELAARTHDGDQESFAALYERHHAGIYDFALRMLRDRDAAADVVQSTFAKAWPALRAADGVENVAAWLYAVARNSSIDELRHRARLALGRADDGRDLGLAELPAPPDTDPAAVAESKELAELVWTSAATLNAKEYSLLDLHVRRGLSADELAENLGLRRGAVYTRLTRLRSSLEQAVTTTLLLRRGRPQCEELDGLAAQLDVLPASRSARRDVERHVEACTTCQETKGLYASPAQIFAALSLVAPPDDLAGAVWPILAGSAGAGAGALVGTAHRLPGRSALAGASTAVVAGLGVVIIGSLLAASLLDDPSGRPHAERGAVPRLPRAAPVVVDKGVVRETRDGVERPPLSRPETVPRAEPPARTDAEPPVAASPPAPPGAPTGGSPPASPPSPPSPPRPSDPPPPPAPPPAPPSPPPAAPPAPPKPPPPSPPPPAVPPASSPPPAPPPAPPPPPPAPPPAPPADNPDEKRDDVCHHGATITVSRSAVPAHLDHGDTLGPCP